MRVLVIDAIAPDGIAYLRERGFQVDEVSSKLPRSELYDLARDPSELKNVIDAEPARARAFRAAIDRRLASEAAAAPRHAQAGDVPIELIEKLGAL